jgi:hypothetical protein
MNGNRVLFLRFAVAAGIASVFGMAAPAEAAGTGEVRISRTSTVAHYAGRGVSVMACRDRRQDCAGVWNSRQFVLILGIGY